jgi:thiol-disulfide isomerase/thioredoxin
VPFWADPAAPRGPGPASVPGAGAPTGDPLAQPGNDPEVSGILAGRVLDAYGRPPGSAFIQVAQVGERAGPPIDVETVNQGHFYIRGLQPGRTYRLTARSKLDGRLLVGEVMARPPETKLLIPMSEELAGASTPPLPGAPQVPQRPRGGTPARPTSPSAVPPPDSPWPANPAAELGPPRSGGLEFGPAPPPEQIATTPDNPPPRASIPGPTAVPGLPSTAPIQPQSYLTTPRTTTACSIANGRVLALSLPDVDGGTWDFSRRRGRLVLLDFWGSWCRPCLRAIPELVHLQSTYGGQGLEVIGIACENGAPADNVRRVQAVRRNIPSINYRLVLADEHGRDSVQSQFGITYYPTLVLLDESGAIVWRGGADQVRELERVIRRRLGM